MASIYKDTHTWNITESFMLGKVNIGQMAIFGPVRVNLSHTVLFKIISNFFQFHLFFKKVQPTMLAYFWLVRRASAFDRGF